ncbi:MAG: SRPBCC domain-containing protein [Bacteroidota bacterium]
MAKFDAMNLHDIHITETFHTAALDIYTILLDERKHGSFTGDFVQITDKEGEHFSLKDGEITGKNVVLERGKKIIWSVILNHADWPKNHVSEVAIILQAHTANETKLDLYHTAIPEQFINQFKVLWQESYAEALHFYLER